MQKWPNYTVYLFTFIKFYISRCLVNVKKRQMEKLFFRILLPFLINILVPQIWLLFVMSSALQYLIQWSVMVCLPSMLHECMKSSISQQRKYITLLNNPKFFRDLMLWIFQHITEDIVRITLTSTHLRNLFSGKEGDLPVGFPDRFNSSSHTHCKSSRLRQTSCYLL